MHLKLRDQQLNHIYDYILYMIIISYIIIYIYTHIHTYK